MPHACRAAAAKSAIAIALPAADARVDGPLGHGSRGSACAVALEQLALRSDNLCDLQHRGEAQGASRHTTADLFEVRGGLRFDERGLRTLSSSRLIEVQAPTSLDTELELEGDSVAVPRAPTAPRRCAALRLRKWPSGDPSYSARTTGRCGRLFEHLVRPLAATTRGGVVLRSAEELSALAAR